MFKKILNFVIFLCLLAPILADEDYSTTKIKITREYWEDGATTNITSFNITFGYPFKELEEIVLFCDYKYSYDDDKYKKNGDWDDIEWDEDSDYCNDEEGEICDNWRIDDTKETDYFDEIKIENVSCEAYEVSDIQNLTESIYNLSMNTVAWHDLAKELGDAQFKHGECDGSRTYCENIKEEYSNSTTYYKELFENTSQVHQSTESNLKSCENTLSTKDTTISTYKGDLDTCDKSKTTIGFVWTLIGGAVGFFFGKRREVAPQEFSQFPGP